MNTATTAIVASRHELSVVPVEPRIDVLGDPDVVTRAIGVDSDDVDDTLLESVHGRNTCDSCADWKGEEIPPTVANAQGSAMCPPPPLRRFGETAFA